MNKAKENLIVALRNLSDELDIPETYYQKAEQRYKAIGKWLERENSYAAAYAPSIYPQGSFLLGTIVKPTDEAQGYDIDLVCELKSFTKQTASQKELKNLVGYEIRKYNEKYGIISPPENKRRCWTIIYSDEVAFHMDILPAIPADARIKLLLSANNVPDAWATFAIAITDKKHPKYGQITDEWLRSNPRGYAEWFRKRMEVQFERQRKILAEAFSAKVEQIPEYKVKTTLQRTIQLLKRHRDISFSNDTENKPVSMIITTLAALAYNNEDNLVDSLLTVVEHMPDYIVKQNGLSLVPNPVDPIENFADKWKENPEKEEAFRQWLSQVKYDVNNAILEGNIVAQLSYLKKRFGEKSINCISERVQGEMGGTALIKAVSQLDRFNVPHRQQPPWPMENRYTVRLVGYYKRNDRWEQFSLNSYPLSKGLELNYVADTNTSKPFSVFWQVVNTGLEAEEKGDLRGSIFESKTKGSGGLYRNERTSYTGTHWIECFIVKDGVCVARSGEFVVNIK